MAYIIIDLDGTCFNIDHRLKHIVDLESGLPLPNKEKDFKKFYENMHLDRPYKQMYIFLKSIVSMEVIPIFLTGRPEKYRNDTIESLNNNFSLIESPLVFMRENKDYRPDYECKGEALKSIIKSYGIKPLFAIDDRDSVINYFREMGILTLDAKLINKNTHI